MITIIPPAETEIRIEAGQRQRQRRLKGYEQGLTKLELAGTCADLYNLTPSPDIGKWLLVLLEWYSFLHEASIYSEPTTSRYQGKGRLIMSHFHLYHKTTGPSITTPKVVDPAVVVEYPTNLDYRCGFRA